MECTPPYLAASISRKFCMQELTWPWVSDMPSARVPPGPPVTAEPRRAVWASRCVVPGDNARRENLSKVSICSIPWVAIDATAIGIKVSFLHTQTFSRVKRKLTEHPLADKKTKQKELGPKVFRIYTFTFKRCHTNPSPTSLACSR